METSVVEALFLPWWKILIYLCGLILAAITIRFTIQFDVNAWLQSRRIANQIKEQLRISKNCAHAWTLFHSSYYSRCNNCLVLIPTSTLLTARKFGEIKPIIFGEVGGMILNPEKETVITNDYIGKRK